MKFADISKAFLLSCIFLPAAAYSQFCGLPLPPTFPDAAVLSSSRPITADSDPKEVVDRAIKNLHATRSYRLRIVSGGSTVENIDYVYPNRLRWFSKFDQAGQPEGGSLLIGDINYHTNDKGDWLKGQLCVMPSSFGQFGPDGLRRRIDEAVKDGSTVRRVGPDTVDERPAIAYQVSIQFGGTSETLALWVGTRDNFLYRAEFRDKPLSETATHAQTTTYSDFNADIKIEPPM